MQTVNVSLGSRSYPIQIGSGNIGQLHTAISQLGDISRILIAIDKNLESAHKKTIESALFGLDIPISWFPIPPGESSKSVAMTAHLWEEFLASGADRNSLVLVIGGGMVGDLGGFAAATYMRGIRVFQVPTTLLAQVDSSVGGKTAIDLDSGKNSVGAFHQPSGVLIDIDFLKTLPNRELISGLGEVVKYGAGLDERLFHYLEKNASKIISHDPAVLSEIVRRCCTIKAKIVKADECETSGIRALLNLGHTFAHAYETADGFTNLLHGEAVAIGLLDAFRLSLRAGEAGIAGFESISSETIERVTDLYTALTLPIDFPAAHIKDKKIWSARPIAESMRKDKKSCRGEIRFVLPTSIGHSEVQADLPEELVLNVLKERLGN